MMPPRTEAVTYCLVNIQTKGAAVGAVSARRGSDIAEHTDTHCHGNERSFSPWGDRAQAELCVLYVCSVCESQGRRADLWAEGHYFMCTRARCSWMHQTGQSSCYCEHHPLCHSHSLRHYASHLLSLSATVSHTPVPHNCGLIPSFSIIIFFLNLESPLLFFSFLSSRSVAASFWLSISLLSSLLSPCSFLLHFFNLFLFFLLAFSLSLSLPVFLLQPQCSSVWIAGMLL